jgi:hypothetical protein
MCRDSDNATPARCGSDRGPEAVGDGRDASPRSELLVTAKTQRWNPEEFLRTLVEAEIAARDASNRPDPTQAGSISR